MFVEQAQKMPSPDLVKMMFDAVEEKDEQAVTDLLEKGVDPNAENVLGFTPFMWACQNSTYQIVKQLIEAGADINKVTEMGRTPMLFAIKGNNIPAVKLLIEKHADLNQRVLEVFVSHPNVFASVCSGL